MKTSLLTFLLVALVSPFSFGQNTTPDKEFTIQLSKTQLDLRPGETNDLTVFISRSKGYAKSKAVFGVSSALPDGVAVTFEPSDGYVDQGKVTIRLSETVKPGQYSIIFNSTVQRKTKGATLKLNVNPPLNIKAVSSGN